MNYGDNGALIKKIVKYVENREILIKLLFQRLGKAISLSVERFVTVSWAPAIHVTPVYENVENIARIPKAAGHKLREN